MKACSKCKFVKSFEEFGKRSDKPHLYKSHCNSCISEKQNSLEYKKNANRTRKVRYHEDESFQGVIKERSKLRWINSREAMIEYHKKWVESNRESVRAYGRFYAALRRSLQKLATPPWVDKDRLKVIYLNCPKGYHVDHVVPLNGKEVCGLHVPWNLQYLTAKENLSKGNRF